MMASKHEDELPSIELLTTTRAVRKRLDLTRPVERQVIEFCISVALQAPNGANRSALHFLVVEDKETRSKLAEIYRRGAADWFATPEQRESLAEINSGDPEKDAAMRRSVDSSFFLYEHYQEVPVIVVPCIEGRTDGAPISAQAGRWGSIIPAVWSFMLAARTKGLGTAFTTLHLKFEEEAAQVLGIPFKDVMQACMLPVAYYKGSKFKLAERASLSNVVHWDKW